MLHGPRTPQNSPARYRIPQSIVSGTRQLRNIPSICTRSPHSYDAFVKLDVCLHVRMVHSLRDPRNRAFDGFTVAPASPRGRYAIAYTRATSIVQRPANRGAFPFNGRRICRPVVSEAAASRDATGGADSGPRSNVGVVQRQTDPCPSKLDRS